MKAQLTEPPFSAPQPPPRATGRRDIRERIVAGGSVPVDPRLSVEQWSARFRQDLEQWAKVAKAANVTAEGQ